jgi:hypothetical protein
MQRNSIYDVLRIMHFFCCYRILEKVCSVKGYATVIVDFFLRETVIVDYDNYLYVKMFAPIIPDIHWLSWFM